MRTVDVKSVLNKFEVLTSMKPFLFPYKETVCIVWFIFIIIMQSQPQAINFNLEKV